jgi:predicted molibdopterin-dependent oxidoreductase YjgC
VLVLGRSLYYWHRNVLIQHSETLKREYGILLLDYPEGFVEISGDDAKHLGVRDGGRIRLVASGGRVQTLARVTDEVKPGSVFVPFYLQEMVNQLATEANLEADSHQPLFVRVEKV